MTLDGDIALVTGASRGIGAGIAEALVRAGARVVGTATTADGAQAISDKLAASGRGMVLDVADAKSVDELFKALSEAQEQPSIVVNNAGITRDTLLARMKEADWDAVINTDLSSVYRVSRGAARSMMKAKRGRIINITSVVGATGNAGQTNYAAAKAGVAGFTRALARELGSRSITVNAIAPGFIDTDMTAALSAEQRDGLSQQIPLNRLGRVEEVAAAVVFLASPGAAYITGEVLHVNGGMFMG